jgi:Protein of unknown function (DUF3592)
MYNAYSWLTSLVCLIAAGYFGCQFLHHKSEADSATNWARISGVVETMTMSTYVGRRSTRTYTPHIAYRFTVNKKAYYGSHISFPEPTFTTSAASDFFQHQYPEGGLISVYYDPQDPAKCCLKPGESAPLDHEAWTAVGFLALAVVLPMLPQRQSWGYGGMYNNPTGMITPSRK